MKTLCRDFEKHSPKNMLTRNRAAVLPLELEVMNVSDKSGRLPGNKLSLR